MSQRVDEIYFIKSQRSNNLFLDMRQYLYYNNSEDKVRQTKSSEPIKVLTDSARIRDINSKYHRRSKTHE